MGDRMVTGPMTDWERELFAVPPAPEVTIGLDPALRAGVAAQLRALADVLDPPGRS